MKKFKPLIIILNLLLVTGYFAFAVIQKEETLDKGKLVLLRLAPVDPRSLMQGDYMRLDYEVNSLDSIIEGRVGRFSKMPTTKATLDTFKKRGYCIVKLDGKGAASRQRLQADILPLKPDEIPIKYFSSGDGYMLQMHIGAESYFFEEGQAKKFEVARYGGIKVDDAGNSVLVGLYDKNHKLIH
jgi:uncharacterized membrane-anchored protein